MPPRVFPSTPNGDVATQLAQGLAALSGVRRGAAAFTFGVAATLALPPIHALPALFVAYTGLLWLFDGTDSKRRAFVVGWWFGLGHFATGLYWFANALLIDGWSLVWLIPFAVGVFPAFLAIFPGVALVLLRWVRPTGIARILGFAAIWTATEWLRGHLLTGFPWNLAAYSWSAWPEMLQPAAWFGAYGLSLLTVAIAALPSAICRSDPGRRRHWPAVVAVAATAAIGLAGWWRISEAAVPDVADVNLRLVQGNVPQSLKWKPDQREGIFARYLDLSRSVAGASGSGRPTTHILWPETAVPYFLEFEPDRLRQIGTLAPDAGAVIVGVVRGEPKPDRGFSLWNGMIAVGRGGEIFDSYDKAHLVPFGEYVPFRGLLGRLPLRVVPFDNDFVPGPGPRTLRLPGLPPMSPLICYEVVFPGSVLDRGDRPSWLLNLTNDAWYGRSSGPYQHFAIAALRAVEEGLPLVRVASTGVTGVVDALGRTRASLPLDVMGTLDSALPGALAEIPPFGRYGDWMLLALVAVVLLLSVSFQKWGRRYGWN